MDRKINKIFDFRGMKLKVLESDTCENCYFKVTACHVKWLKKITGNCTYLDRKDKKNVIFKEVSNNEI